MSSGDIFFGNEATKLRIKARDVCPHAPHQVLLTLLRLRLVQRLHFIQNSRFAGISIGTMFDSKSLLLSLAITSLSVKALPTALNSRGIEQTRPSAVSLFAHIGIVGFS
jgi:hypothetical protein